MHAVIISFGDNSADLPRSGSFPRRLRRCRSCSCPSRAGGTTRRSSAARCCCSWRCAADRCSASGCGGGGRGCRGGRRRRSAAAKSPRRWVNGNFPPRGNLETCTKPPHRSVQRTRVLTVLRSKPHITQTQRCTLMAGKGFLGPSIVEAFGCQNFKFLCRATYY